MNFYIQDPSFTGTYSTHEALLKVCENGQYGGGAYAFVTAGGAKLFFEDEVFEALVTKGKFKVIVGIDEVTSEKALIKLNELRTKYKGNLELKAFMHDTKGSLFHPKFSWIKNENGGFLVIGSSNLTEKGLRRNREAFSIIEVDDSKIAEIEAYWESWLDHNKRFLKEIDDEEVLEKGRLNTKMYSNFKKKMKLDAEVESLGEQEEVVEEESNVEQEPFSIEEEDFEAWSFSDDDIVLLTEINKNGNRLTQANFTQTDFENFFGGDLTNENSGYRVLFRSVRSNGALGEVEIRPGVPTKSKNYRFELRGAAGQLYPDPRPIGVFIRVSTRVFLYILAMPNEPYYDEIRSYLNGENLTAPATRMKRHLANVQELHAQCPNLPFWNIT